ncbi:aminotransferase class V-fold PLP-dependent enzyme [Paenibacillus sp. MBLB4367]|uniref:aminotransferase class V-fold PLP-dependent enzyme n=1 Tax=Paenibacillus sp. MBLB4367 TaxID=3384767 RepID=UPI00390821D7
MKNALLGKESFVGLDKFTWLYGGAETPPHITCIEAMNTYMQNRAKGPEGRELHTLAEQSLRRNIAKLLNGREQDIALLSNASECITAIVHALELKEGDNVVINTLEYPSGVMPVLQLQNEGVEVRIVEHTDWQVSVDAMMEQVDSRTRLVMASHVSYLSGARFDHKALYAQLKKTDALFLLDVTQSLGAVSVDMNEADFVVSSSYKWLLAVHGLGILGINPARTQDLVPHSVGWRSVKSIFHDRRFQDYDFLDDARRFELGYPSYPSIYAMNASTGLLLETGIDRIEEHIAELGGRLIRELTALGYSVMTPADPQQRAGNIAVAFERGGELADSLREQGVLVWGGDGRFRASIHGYNDSADIDKLLALLPAHTAALR